MEYTLVISIYGDIVISANVVVRNNFFNVSLQLLLFQNVSGFLSSLSCVSSVLILSVVTWDRFVSVTQPLARKQLSRKTAAATLLFFWCLATIIALLPITHFAQDYFGEEFYGNNGVCLSLHIHEPYTMVIF